MADLTTGFLIFRDSPRLIGAISREAGRRVGLTLLGGLSLKTAAEQASHQEASDPRRPSGPVAIRPVRPGAPTMPDP